MRSVIHDVPIVFTLAQEALRPPTFVQKMSNFRALEGDTVRLECKVDASPPPQLFWKKDKEMLRIDPTRMRWAHSVPTHSISTSNRIQTFPSHVSVFTHSSLDYWQLCPLVMFVQPVPRRLGQAVLVDREGDQVRCGVVHALCYQWGRPVDMQRQAGYQL